jgi:hypothetical protein
VLLLLVAAASAQACSCEDCTCKRSELFYLSSANGVDSIVSPFEYPPSLAAWPMLNSSFYVGYGFGSCTAAPCLSGCPLSVAAGQSRCEIQFNAARLSVPLLLCATSRHVIRLTVQDDDKPFPSYSIRIISDNVSSKDGFYVNSGILRYAYCQPFSEKASFLSLQGCFSTTLVLDGSSRDAWFLVLEVRH